MSDAKFKLVPLNHRDARYYPEGSMELKRQLGSATAQVWVVTPNDLLSLFILTSKEIVKRHEQTT